MGVQEEFRCAYPTGQAKGFCKGVKIHNCSEFHSGPAILFSHPVFSGVRGKIGNRKRSPGAEGDAMKTETIQIVDHGRGPQLSSSRITVQDLLPYYRDNTSNKEIRRWIPSLTYDEIALAERLHPRPLRRSCADRKGDQGVSRPHAGRATSLDRANDHLSIEERKALLRKKLHNRKRSKAVVTILLMKTLTGTPNTCRVSFFHLHGAVSVPCSACALSTSRRSALPRERRISRFGSSANTSSST